MSTKTGKARLTRIFKVQFTDEQADELERLALSEGSSGAALLRRAAIQHFSLPTETPNREIGSHNGARGDHRQEPGALGVKNEESGGASQNGRSAASQGQARGAA